MAEDEYRELFVAEALDIVEGLNSAITALESNPGNTTRIDEIFRMMHTLKGNAMGMGYTGIGELAHVIEDIFGEIKKDKSLLSGDLVQTIFKAIDKLGELVDALSSGQEVNYKGLRTKLEVHLQNIISAAAPPLASADTGGAGELTVLPGSGAVVSEPAEEPGECEALSTAEAGRPETNPPANPVETSVPENNVSADVLEETPSQDNVQQALAEAGPQPMAGHQLPQAAGEPEESPVLEDIAEDEPAEATPVFESQPLHADVSEIEETKSKISFSETIQVPTRKADDLLTLIGELLIERDAVVSSIAQQNGHKSITGFDRLNRIVSDLQYGIMNIRLVKVGFLFNKFTRIVRDVANIETKEVDLKLEGTEIEIDRNILKTISDAMIHIVRNAVSHGIESPEKRRAKGKPRKGQVTLKARNENDNVIIEVSDDGNGIDHEQILRKAIAKGIVDAETATSMTRDEILMFIFEPGFSNAEVVNEVSGRGVGMDVVKKTTESIGGRVQVTTALGKGTTISLHLPSSLAVKGALLFELDKQEFAITINYTEAVVSIKPADINWLPNGYVATYLGDPIPILFLNQFFENPRNVTVGELDKNALPEKLDVIVVRYQYRLIGLVVDKLLLQQEIVEKNLKGMLSDHELFKSATILGNGNVCLILDIPSVFRMVQEKSKFIKKAA